MTDHEILSSVLLFFKFQMCFKNAVFVKVFMLKESLWLLYIWF